MPRTLTPLLTAALAAGCCAAAAPARTPQQPGARDAAGEFGRLGPPADRDALRAEELYRQGEALAGFAPSDTASALKAFREALRLYLKLYTEGRLPGPGFGSETPDRYRALMRERLRLAPECVGRYLSLSGGVSIFERSQLEAFRGQALMLREADDSRAVFFHTEADEPARITHKPVPDFTEEARRNNLRGAVRLRAVLAADGTVKHVLVLKGLPHGMSEESVSAAAKIKFTPAVRRGRPVAQFVALEYHFNTF